MTEKGKRKFSESQTNTGLSENVVESHKKTKKDMKTYGYESNNAGENVKGDKSIKKDFKKSSNAKKPFKKYDKGKYDKFKKSYKGNSGKSATSQDSTEKPNWAEMRKNKKDVRDQRRKGKITVSVFELSSKAKLLAARIARRSIKREERDNLCEELHNLLIKGQYLKFAMSHDLTRVIQVLLKHASKKIKKEIADELMSVIVQMMQSKYSHHSVKSILKNGTDDTRKKVIECFFGHIVQLAAHKISAPILDYAYSELATQNQKERMQQEFYGDMYTKIKDASVHKLSDAYKTSPELKGAILYATKANLERVLGKNLHDGELLQTVLHDYICECDDMERVELITTLCPLVVPLGNSAPGALTASICIFRSTNKDKKTILKVVKEHVVSLCTHKTAYRILLAIFKAVDDTVMVKKAIIPAILKNVKEIAKDQWGRRTLTYIVAPKDSLCFHPSLIKWMADEASLGNSKKDPELRINELREATVPALCQEIKEDPAFWLADCNIALLTLSILKAASATESKDALESIAKHITSPVWNVKDGEKDVNGIEDAGMHLCLKKLLQHDRNLTPGGPTFGTSLSQALTEETTKNWITSNRGCFILVTAVENNSDAVKETFKSKLLPNMDVLKNNSFAGSKLLIEKVF